MNGDKNKLILMILAGVWGILVLVLAYMLWDVSSSHSEAAEALEGEEINLERYYSAKVFPSAKSTDSVNANTTKLKAWYEAIHSSLAVGDKSFDPHEGASAFKERLLAEVRSLQSEPVSSEKKICSAGFLFGFERYLGEANEMPKSADIPRLQVELDFTRFIVERIVDTRPERKENGKSVYSDIEISLDGLERLGEIVAAEKNPDQRSFNQKKTMMKKGAMGEKSEDLPADHAWRFRLTMSATPSSFMKFLNVLAVDPRFVTVADLSFRVKTDPVVERFTAAEKNAEAAGSRRGRRGRRASEVKEETSKANDTASRLITDPMRDAVYVVKMVLVLRDFGSQAGGKAEEVKEGGK